MSYLLPALLWLVPILYAGGDDVGSISGPRSNPSGSHILSLGLGGGASFLLGGPGAAYGAGFCPGIVLDVPLGEVSGFTVELDHSLHRVSGAAPLFVDPETITAEGAVTGSQRFWNADIGFRLGIPVVDETRVRPGAVTAVPWFRMAGGVSLVDTVLDVPSFEGKERLHTRRPVGAVVPGLGVSIHVLRFLTVQPALKAAAYLGIDHDEVEGGDTFRVEWRLLPKVDVLFHI